MTAENLEEIALQIKKDTVRADINAIRCPEDLFREICKAAPVWMHKEYQEAAVQYALEHAIQPEFK
jgi:hypothetical protein